MNLTEYSKTNLALRAGWVLCLLNFLSACNQNNDTNSIIWAQNNNVENSDSYLYYKGELYSGIVKDTFPNGKVKFIKHYKKGFENGEINGWHYNGKLSYSYQSINGKREGTYVEYYPSGKLQIRQFYKNGVLIENKIIDINGKTLVNSKTKNGRIYGLLGSSECRSVYDENKFIKQENK